VLNYLCTKPWGVWGSGCIDPHFLDLGTSWWWVVRFTPRPLYPWGKSPWYPHWIGGWADPRAGLDDVEKRKLLTLSGLELRPLGRSARSQSLYYAIPARSVRYELNLKIFFEQTSSFKGSKLHTRCRWAASFGIPVTRQLNRHTYWGHPCHYLRYPRKGEKTWLAACQVLRNRTFLVGFKVLTGVNMAIAVLDLRFSKRWLWRVLSKI
jgi:hypothetical protein